MSFDPLKDLVPVASVATNQFFLSVNPSLPVSTFPEFVEYARKAKPPLTYASGGNGSQHQLGIEMLKQRTGIDMLHVPYRGGAPAGTATIAGETQVVLAGASNAPHLKSGQLRGLATTGKNRSPLFPDLPTIGEFYPGYELTIWLGLFAPAATPEPIVTTLRNEVRKALSQKEFADKLNVTGALQPLIDTPEEFSALIRRDYEKYGKLAKEIGIRIE
jgi:tripartite-type tricarboxylate transporter receptor subunit TctC